MNKPLSYPKPVRKGMLCAPKNSKCSAIPSDTGPIPSFLIQRDTFGSVRGKELDTSKTYSILQIQLWSRLSLKAFHSHHWTGLPPSTDAPIWICFREGPRDAAEAEPSAQACEKSLTRRQKAFWRRFCHFTATRGPARDVSDSATQHCIFEKFNFF